MEYAKDEVFSISYMDDSITKKRTNPIITAIKKNVLIKLIIGLTLILSVANCVIIYNFFSILSKI